MLTSYGTHRRTFGLTFMFKLQYIIKPFNYIGLNFDRSIINTNCLYIWSSKPPPEPGIHPIIPGATSPCIPPGIRPRWSLDTFW